MENKTQIIYNKFFVVLNRRILFFFVFLAVFSIAFSIGAEMEVSEEDAGLFLDEFNKLLDSLKGENFGLEIFLHNIEIALPMFIPGFGIVWGIFSAFSTGFAFAAIATTNSLLEKIPPITMIFTTPFGLMEACSIFYWYVTKLPFDSRHSQKKIHLTTMEADGAGNRHCNRTAVAGRNRRSIHD
ncbi:hypothetical protein [Candidatus Nitrosotenuis chungbukensis]|uniref:hypothetical protein n=1 Tax=Candidatus Nitrosotenuis chungbukensis TaxID=1353246 RepID=UPI002A4E123F|nr:hypothetical protein [Candidatus Nitrosotenuis chungbukensis]